LGPMRDFRPVPRNCIQVYERKIGVRSAKDYERQIDDNMEIYARSKDDCKIFVIAWNMNFTRF